MKRILRIVAVTGLLTAAPAFAGIEIFVEFVPRAPVYVAPAPVHVTPAVYRHGEPRWHEWHGRFERRETREHHWHHWHHDYREIVEFDHLVVCDNRAMRHSSR